MSKIDDLLERAARFIMKRWGLDEHGGKRHPGMAYHARTEISSRKKPTENPHLTTWTRFMKHLFGLMLDGYGGSPAAMQIRDRLQFHWKFMDHKEQVDAMNRYQQHKFEHEQRQVEKQFTDAQSEQNKQRFRDVAEELDNFMAPKGN